MTDNKVFIISFMKSGITSASQFLKDLGYKQCKTIRYKANRLVKDGKFDKKTFDTVLKNGDFFADQPIFVIWEHLAIAYPTAKFICTYRDVESWYGSFKNWSIKRNLLGDTKDNLFSFWLQRPDLLKLKTSRAMIEKCEAEGLENSIKDLYLEHNKSIQNYFKDKDNLFFAPINTDNTQELKEFLNKKNSKVFWGHHNKSVY